MNLSSEEEYHLISHNTSRLLVKVFAISDLYHQIQSIVSAWPVSFLLARLPNAIHIALNTTFLVFPLNTTKLIIVTFSISIGRYMSVPVQTDRYHHFIKSALSFTRMSFLMCYWYQEHREIQNIKIFVDYIYSPEKQSMLTVSSMTFVVYIIIPWMLIYPINATYLHTS